MNVTDIRSRGRPRLVAYTVLSVHEGVLVAELARALTDHGMTMSNIAGQGVVIHRIGQDPHRPAERPPG